EALPVTGRTALMKLHRVDNKIVLRLWNLAREATTTDGVDAWVRTSPVPGDARANRSPCWHTSRSAETLHEALASGHRDGLWLRSPPHLWWPRADHPSRWSPRAETATPASAAVRQRSSSKVA